MICQIQHKTGGSGNCLGYDFGDMMEKDQVVEIIDFANVSFPPSWVSKLSRVPQDAAERKTLKKDAHKIANALSKQFDALAKCADERCRTTAVEYIYSFSPEDRDNGTLTAETVRSIIREHLEKMGVHGDVEKRDMHKAKKGKVPKKYHREVMYVATAHKGTNAYHVHVYTSRLDVNTFKVSNIHGDHKLSKILDHELNMKYGLVETTENYNRDISKSNPGWQHKVEMAETVAAAKKTATSEQEFISLLQEQGVFVTTIEGPKPGYVYSSIYSPADPEKAAKVVNDKSFSGAQLSKCLKNELLTRPKVLEQIRVNFIEKQKKQESPQPDTQSKVQDPLVEALKNVFVETGTTSLKGKVHTVSDMTVPYVYFYTSTGKMLTIKDNGEFELIRKNPVKGNASALRGCVSNGILPSLLQLVVKKGTSPPSTSVARQAAQMRSFFKSLEVKGEGGHTGVTMDKKSEDELLEEQQIYGPRR